MSSNNRAPQTAASAVKEQKMTKGFGGCRDETGDGKVIHFNCRQAILCGTKSKNQQYASVRAVDVNCKKCLTRIAHLRRLTGKVL